MFAFSATFYVPFLIGLVVYSYFIKHALHPLTPKILFWLSPLVLMLLILLIFFGVGTIGSGELPKMSLGDMALFIGGFLFLAAINGFIYCAIVEIIYQVLTYFGSITVDNPIRIASEPAILPDKDAVNSSNNPMTQSKETTQRESSK